jgi:hypothetical protein
VAAKSSRAASSTPKTPRDGVFQAEAAPQARQLAAWRRLCIAVAGASVCWSNVVETVYDWVTMAVFGGLVVLFLHRSTHPGPDDPMWRYLPPAVGCAVANYVGNQGYSVVSALILAAVLAYVLLVLHPFRDLRF